MGKYYAKRIKISKTLIYKAIRKQLKKEVFDNEQLGVRK
jgi:hypothetical protein